VTLSDLAKYSMTRSNIPTGTLIGASNAGGVGKITILHQYLASSRVVNGHIANCYTHSCAGPWQVGDTHRW